MKRLLLMLALIMLVAEVSGFSVTFQDPGDFVNYVSCTGSAPNYPTCSWIQNSTGGNSYIYTSAQSGAITPSSYGIINIDPEETTYAAVSLISYSETNSGNYIQISLINSAGTVMYTAADNIASVSITNPYRYEVVMSGGNALIYRNGIRIATSGVIASNPSYVSFQGHMGGGSLWTYCSWDDFVYGSTESKYIFSIPETGAYVLKKDMINPASSGLAYSNGTTISSYNMTTTFGKGTNTSETLELRNFGTGIAMCTYTTPSGSSAGFEAWPLQECIFNNPNADYGYYVTTIAGTNEFSHVIPYIGSGASVAFDQSDYSLGDTATITYSVQGSYWDTATYNYRIQTQDIYGTIVDSQAFSTQTGTISFTFDSTDTAGVYYAIAIATPKSGGDDIWMNFGTAEVTGYIRFNGYINNAETCNPINTNYINITQNGIFDAQTTIDGNYSTSAATAFTTGSSTAFNVTSAGYSQYLWSFTPLVARTITKNITLVPASPSFTGIGLNGIISESVYGAPLAGATVAATNATYSESYSTLTNECGYYLFDESKGVFLTSGRCYNVTASKSGYGSNSALKCVWGA